MVDFKESLCSTGRLVFPGLVILHFKWKIVALMLYYILNKKSKHFQHQFGGFSCPPHRLPVLQISSAAPGSRHACCSHHLESLNASSLHPWKVGNWGHFSTSMIVGRVVPLMEEILHHLVCIKTLYIIRKTTYQLVQDSFHQQYDGLL